MPSFQCLILCLEYRPSFELMGTAAEGIPYWSGCLVAMMSSSCFKTQNWRIQQNVEYGKSYWQQNTEYSKVLNLARITKSWKQGKVSVPRASSGRTLCSLLSNLLLPSTTLPHHQPTFMKQSKYKYKNIKIWICITISQIQTHFAPTL